MMYSVIFQEQVIMSYGGLRGGVGFSLVNMIPLTVGKMGILNVASSLKQFQLYYPDIFNDFSLP